MLGQALLWQLLLRHGVSQVFNAKGSCVSPSNSPAQDLGVPRPARVPVGAVAPAGFVLLHAVTHDIRTIRWHQEPVPPLLLLNQSWRGQKPAALLSPLPQPEHPAAGRGEPEQPGTEKAITAFCSTQCRCLPRCCSLSLIAKQLLTFPFILSFLRWLDA